MACVSIGARKLQRLAAAAPALLAAACTTVGPDYRRPEVRVPAEFRFQVSPTTAGSFADLPWWAVFDDPALQSLISEALANNYDLQVAAARIEQARAVLGIVGSQGRPQVDYSVSAGREETFTPLPSGADTVTFSSIGAVIEASWEIDVWGRIRRATEAARADLLAQEHVRRGVVLSLVSDVASGYFRLLALDRELAIAEESARSYRDTFDLFSLRYEAGKDSRLAADRAEAAYQSSLANIENLRREIAIQENALSVLLGAQPRAIARGRPMRAQTTPPTPLGASTELLQRRPDILAAEQAMISANAQIGVAVADYFPRVGLSALAGPLGVDIGGNTDTLTTWNFALSAAGPIFSGGRLEEAYNLRKAFWDESVAQYRQTVLGAFREVSDALAAQQTLARQRTALRAQVAALRSALDMAMLRYDGGRASYFEVLEAQQQLYPTEDALARVERDQLLAVVNLYRALGGGWSMPAASAGINPPVPSVSTPSNPRSE